MYRYLREGGLEASDVNYIGRAKRCRLVTVLKLTQSMSKSW